MVHQNEMREFSDRLRNALNEAGRDGHGMGARVAKAAGVTPKAASKWLNGEARPSHDKLLKLSRWLGVREEWLEYGRGARSPDVIVEPTLVNHGSGTNVVGPEVKVRSRRVPVKGAAQLGPNGYFEALNYPVEQGDGYLMIESRDIDAYGLKVVGNSMMPRIKHHEYVVIEPNQIYVAGDEVLVCTHDGQCMIKIFLWLRDGQYRFDSINDDFEPVYLMENEVEHIHYVGAIVKPSRHMP
ncbi:hypothetical protein A6R74_16055 [Halomonas sp. ALS9]|nr:hypothetical protein A6R74_16055 [Halomonas sp. ALS9]